VAHVITEQLYNHAHVAKPYASMLEDMTNKFDNAQFANEVVRQIGHADLSQLSKDNNAAKNYANFLVSIAKAMPKLVLRNISMFLPHMDAELYTIRNGMIDTIGELVMNAFDGSKDDTQQTRNQLLECLQARFLDNNAFCRSNTMEVWARLIETRGIVPLDFVSEITDLTVRRLHDKGAVVRKRALQLLAALIKNNPFCPSLNVSALRARLEKETPRFEAASATIAAALNLRNKENEVEAPPAPQQEQVVAQDGSVVAEAPMADVAAAAPEPQSRELPREHVDAVKVNYLCLICFFFFIKKGMELVAKDHCFR
jgi:condensin complex subunit 1